MPILEIGKLRAASQKLSAFWAWTACRAPELAEEQAYAVSFKFSVQSFAEQHRTLQLGHSLTLDFRGADCQHCFWGKQKLHEHQPAFSSLNIELGSVMVKLGAFQQIEQLYQSASFDWGGVSSENHLPAHWKRSAAASSSLSAACRQSWQSKPNGKAYLPGACQSRHRRSFRPESFRSYSSLLESNFE